MWPPPQSLPRVCSVGQEAWVGEEQGGEQGTMGEVTAGGRRGALARELRVPRIAAHWAFLLPPWKTPGRRKVQQQGQGLPGSLVAKGSSAPRRRAG